MMKVNSSMLNEIDYDDATKTLTVEFSNGARFVYDQVPRIVYDKITTASSIGSTFNGLVKSKGYRYRKLEEK